MRDLIGRTLGHYRIVEKIGEGGMGEVYRAHDERLDRDVAIKVLHRDVAQDADRLSRFEREAKAVAKLDHPNILAIHDFGTKEGVTYSATELLEGESLRGLISAGGITTSKAVEHAQAIADGLAAAHDKGIIHRDLKPENVFLTKDGRIKILDFGLAKLKLPEADLTTETPTATLDTDPSGLIGTVPYMAPEQVQGQPADHRSDIFALGVVLYELLTGNRPFGGSTTVETAAAILKEDPEPISVAAPAVPPTLGSVVSKCLEKRPEDRFSSAHDLALTLGAFDTAAQAPAIQPQSVILKRWPHILAVVIATVIALFFLFPPQGLFERLAEQPAEAPLPRIVVLPFENLGSPEDEYFADGITDEIISRLAAVSGLQVISRTSAMYYKDKNLPLQQIGEELDVGYVLEGTIRWDRSEGDLGRVRITPQLIRVEDDSHLWADRYDRVLEDIFVVQSEIAQNVTGQLQVSLLEHETSALVEQPTDNPEAYEVYLRGIENTTLNEYEQILLTAKMFERAVELDPGFARAWEALSRVNSYLYGNGFDPTPQRRLLAREAAEEAVALRPEMPAGHFSMGYFFYKCDRDYENALQKCADTLKIQPKYDRALVLQALILRRQGKWEESTTLLEWAFKASPRDFQRPYMLANNYSFLRDYDKAEGYAEKAISLAPDEADGYLQKFRMLRRQGKSRDAHAFLARLPMVFPSFEISQIDLEVADREFEKALETVRRIPERVFEQTHGSMAGPALRSLLECECLYYLGDRQGDEEACNQARFHLEETVDEYGEQPFLHYGLGAVNAYLGRREDAIQEGERAAALTDGDAMLYPQYLQRLAYIYTLVGEHDTALDQIEYLLSNPGELTTGSLRIHPYWDPLRVHPRFQALLEKYDTN